MRSKPENRTKTTRYLKLLCEVEKKLPSQSFYTRVSNFPPWIKILLKKKHMGEAYIASLEPDSKHSATSISNRDKDNALFLKRVTSVGKLAGIWWISITCLDIWMQFWGKTCVWAIFSFSDESRSQVQISISSSSIMFRSGAWGSYDLHFRFIT